MQDPAALRDAASLILLRDADTDPRILIGQRGRNAAFMPSKFVFPGGAVDPGDAAVPIARPLAPSCAARLGTKLREGAGASVPEALPRSAIRELWEETGLRLGRPDPRAEELASSADPDWRGFLAAGLLPDAGALSFVFRAVTPPGRPRRFDARFFLAHAEDIAGDPDDFSAACDELSHLTWVRLREARGHDLPFITEVVLAEVEELVARGGPPEAVPYFYNTEGHSHFLRL